MYKLINYIVFILIFFPNLASAYGGPGSSLGAIVVVLGIIGAFFLSILSFFWYPIKRLIRKFKSKNSDDNQNPSGED
ncbi:MAG: hypothetical protein H6912_04705 [Kordiimonadaceae bacterium]|nr:hypothetical protein [Kordiimonadaceae bacterium]